MGIDGSGSKERKACNTRRNRDAFPSGWSECREWASATCHQSAHLTVLGPSKPAASSVTEMRPQWSDRWPCNRRDQRQSAMAMERHRTDPRLHSSCGVCSSIRRTPRLRKRSARSRPSAAQGPAAFGCAGRAARSGPRPFQRTTQSHHRRFVRRRLL